ncbi:MAG: HNH endonuclease [Nocardioides sp.]|nr:HNH endonuclease [Nocardioides sp.]
MTQPPTPTRGHPVSALAARLHDELDTAPDLPVWSMTQTEAAHALASLTRLAARVAALELRLAAHAQDVAVEDLNGATSTATWWAHETQQTRAAAHRKTVLASRVRGRPALAAAWALGDLLADQAGVIIDALDALPAGLDQGVLEQAETHLLTLARSHDAKALRKLGQHLLSVVAPEVGEAHEAAILASQERDAAAAARFSMVDDGQGKVHGRFTLPALHGAMLRKALLALSAPKHQAAVEGRAVLRPSAEKLGRAFLHYVERYPADRLPDAGGVAATVVVTMPLDGLLAQLDTGESLTASEARRLACQAGIIPAVLGTSSQVLDLGRQTRFHTKTQRIALGLRDGGCTAQGCDWPPGLCHAHHQIPWHLGGTTDVTTGRLLCPRHHARAHDPTYRTTTLRDGKVAFITRQ